jgi:hypothetical protein
VVHWLLRYDIGKVIKTIVDDEKFSEYALPKKPTERKEQRRKKRSPLNKTALAISNFSSEADWGAIPFNE